MQHMLMGAYRNVRGGGGVLSQQHESAEGKNVTRVCGLKARHFQGGSVKLDQRGRGMHDAGLSMCFTGRAE